MRAYDRGVGVIGRELGPATGAPHRGPVYDSEVALRPIETAESERGLKAQRTSTRQTEQSYSSLK